MPQLLQFRKTPLGLEDAAGRKGLVATVMSAISGFIKHKDLRLAAALSFYTVLSFAPLLLVMVGVAGYMGERKAVAEEMVGQVTTVMGPTVGEVASAVLESADEPKETIAAIVIGIVFLLFGATGAFVQLQDALNTVWDVEHKPGGSFRSFIRSRLVSFAMVLGIGFLFLVSLVISAGITLLQNKYVSPEQGWFWQSINIVASIILMSGLVTLMYKLLPDVFISWRAVILGAVVTGTLLTAGKFAIGLYLGYSGVGSAYGAAGSLEALIVWIYFSALIVLFGAELTQVYVHRRGAAIIPKPHARLKEH